MYLLGRLQLRPYWRHLKTRFLLSVPSLIVYDKDSILGQSLLMLTSGGDIKIGMSIWEAKMKKRR